MSSSSSHRFCSFLLQHRLTDRGVKSENSVDIFGQTWKALASRTQADTVSGFFQCVLPDCANLRNSRVTVKARFRFGNITNEKPVFDGRFDAHQKTIQYFFPGIDNQEWRNLPLTLELYGSVELVPLVKVKTRDFSVAKTRFEDVVLKVDEERFYVSKTVLASFSTYFEALFFGSFQESKQSEIELKGIDAETLQDFLQIIYLCPNINENNVESLLEMARMYDVQPVTDQCLKFVKGQNLMTDGEKLLLERQYGLNA